MGDPQIAHAQRRFHRPQQKAIAEGLEQNKDFNYNALERFEGLVFELQIDK